MANEMNKVPCGGFKVGGGLSVNDGMLKMGYIITAEVYIEDNPTRVGLLIPYKAIQFDNPIFTQTIDMGDQTTITIDVYDSFVGVRFPNYKVIFSEDEKIKQASINVDGESSPVCVQVGQMFTDNSGAAKTVDIQPFSSDTNAGEKYRYVVEMDIPDEIEEVLHFGGKGWFLKERK